MKKSLLVLSLFISSMAATKAQCTIVNTCTPTAGYCSTPASASALPNGTESVAYSTVIQMSLGTTASGISITDATITAVSGMPTGLTYSTNPTSGVIVGGADGCILISGIPAAATAGSYTVTANVTVNTAFGAIPGTLTWSLTINAAAGIQSQTINQATLIVAPNPATSQISVAADFHFTKVNVFDVMGNLSLSQEVNGAYKTTIDIGKLNAGIYFLQAFDGNKVVTRKFIKD